MVNLKSILAQATDPSLKEPDLGATFDFVEEIQRQKKGGAKDAVAAIRRNLLTAEPTVQCHTIEVLDACMKNCGDELHAEVFSKSFMDAMKTVVKDGNNDKLINRALELLSQWNAGLTTAKGHSLVKDTCAELQKDGIFFPEAQVPKASFLEKAPEWVKGERCFYCRDEFSKMSLTKGRHHCRNCGNSVCGACSNQTIPLPHYNMPKPQRVCDKCYRTLKSGAPTVKGPDDNEGDALPEEYLHSSLAKESQKPQTNRDTELQEQEELEMAMAISLSDQQSQPKPSSQTQPPRTTVPMQATDDLPMYRDIPSAPTYEPLPEPEYTNPQLNAYLDRDRWEQQHKAQKQQNDVGPTATTVPSSQPSSATGSPLADAMKKTIETFLQRMTTVSSAGKSIASDVSVQSMFESLTVMHPQLLAQLEALQEQKSAEEGTLRKIDEVKEARVSLNAMRRQHLEKVRQQEEEQSMLARMQMEQKLALLRQQKNEQLTYQRELEQRRREELEDQETRRLQIMQEQLELERSRLKLKEQQLIQQQFGSHVVPGMQQVTLTDHPSLPQAPPMESTVKGPHFAGMYDPPISLANDYLHSTNTKLVGENTAGLGLSYMPPSYSMVNPQIPPPTSHTQLQLPNLNPQPLSLPPPSSYTQPPPTNLNPQPSSLQPSSSYAHYSAPPPVSLASQPVTLPPFNAGTHNIPPDVTNPLSNAPTMMNPPYQLAIAPTMVPPMNYGGGQLPASTAFEGGYQYNQPHPPQQQQQVPPLYTSAPPNVYGAPPFNQPAVQEAELISFD